MKIYAAMGVSTGREWFVGSYFGATCNGTAFADNMETDSSIPDRQRRRFP